MLKGRFRGARAARGISGPFPRRPSPNRRTPFQRLRRGDFGRGEGGSPDPPRHDRLLGGAGGGGDGAEYVPVYTSGLSERYDLADGGRERALRRADASKCLLTGLAVACLTLAVMPHSAYAGGGGSYVYGSGHGHAHHFRAGGHRLIFGHRSRHFHGWHKAHKLGRHFGRHRHHKGHRHVRFRRHHRLKHRYVYVPRYYYGYGRKNGYRYYPRPSAGYGPTAYDPPSRPSEYKPPTPKWVHVGTLDSDTPSFDESAPSEEGRLATNCLSVRTEITVDGEPVEAFGKACLQADGSWRLIPGEPARY